MGNTTLLEMEDGSDSPSEDPDELRSSESIPCVFLIPWANLAAPSTATLAPEEEKGSSVVGVCKSSSSCTSSVAETAVAVVVG